MKLEKHEKINRIVVKIGTSSLTHSTGRLNYSNIEKMVDVICDLKNIGYEMVLVTSGAIGVGLGKTEITEKPKEVAGRRALAVIGQSSLMALYEELFGVYSCKVAQVLLTKSALKDEANNHNIANAFSKMFEYMVLPIVNENDVVTSDNKSDDDMFGDNDTLSATVAQFIKADLLILWSDIDGLFDTDPRFNPEAKLIPRITEINDDLYRIAGGAGTTRGSGGMTTKINAGKISMDAGIKMIITNSSQPENLYEILNNKPIGTLFESTHN